MLGGLGPYPLTFAFPNTSDHLSVQGGAESAFVGNQGTAAISRDHESSDTVFLGFPFEAIGELEERKKLLTRVLQFCFTDEAPFLFVDGFESGNPTLWDVVE